MLRVISVFLLASVAASVVVGSDPRITPAITEREAREVILAHDLEVIGLTTNTASLIRRGKTDKALQLLEQRLSASLSSANQLLNDGIRLEPGKGASLRQAPGRAVDYAVQYGRTELTAPARSVAAKVNQQPDLR
ncbi:MAG: hypothetical protein ABI837_03895 [Acidobacteriota bacterium]